MHFEYILSVISLCGYASASPLAIGRFQGRQTTINQQALTVEQLSAIAPSTAACNATASFAEECRDATQAVPQINAGFDKFSIETIGEQAAILSLMLFETGNLKFDRNQ